ncbi:MAG: Gldg family protein [Acidobacteriota bacterium]|nr:MAG: Gldg family protein [Acidobacteriota bacterium]
MLRKFVDSFGSLGPILILIGFFQYTVTSLWDWKVQVFIYVGLALLIVFLAFNLEKVKKALTSRSARLGGTALVTLILVVGILALINFLNFKHHKRIDLSEGGQFALSEQTRKILDNLDEQIQIIGFFQDQAGAARFQGQVQEYRYYSSKVDYEIVDPQEEPGKVAQNQVTRNGQVIVAGSSKREVIEDINEEKLTNAIVKVTREGEKTVYFLTGHGERSLDDIEGEGYSTVKAEVEKQNYLVQSYNLAQENRIPEDAEVIISAGPQVNFFPNEVQLLEEHLAQGGKFFLLVDPESEFEMNDFLARYGVGFDQDFVVDASGVGQLFGFGPAAPLVADYGDHPITEDLDDTMSILPTTRSVLSDVGDSGYGTTILASSSPQSWGEMNIEGESVSFDEGQDRQGPLALAVAAVKVISSFGESGEMPGAEAESAEETAGDSAEPAETVEKESRIVLFGDPDFASNAYFSTAVNGDLFLNVVSWLAEDADLVSVRPKDPENRQVTLTATESRLIFWTTVILFPLATLVFGVAVWFKRR